MDENQNQGFPWLKLVEILTIAVGFTAVSVVCRQKQLTVQAPAVTVSPPTVNVYPQIHIQPVSQGTTTQSQPPAQPAQPVPQPVQNQPVK
jgi:hypothetical protein